MLKVRKAVTKILQQSLTVDIGLTKRELRSERGAEGGNSSKSRCTCTNQRTKWGNDFIYQLSKTFAIELIAWVHFSSKLQLDLCRVTYSHNTRAQQDLLNLIIRLTNYELSTQVMPHIHKTTWISSCESSTPEIGLINHLSSDGLGGEIECFEATIRVMKQTVRDLQSTEEHACPSIEPFLFPSNYIQSQQPLFSTCWCCNHMKKVCPDAMS